MSTLLAAARAVHFAATLWLFGELALACALTLGAGSGAASGAADLLRRRLPAVARWSIGIGIASALAWLAAVAAMMSGMPLAQAIDSANLGAVLGETLFGRVWIVRLVLACALLLALWRPVAGRVGLRMALGAAGAGAYLGALAWTGHAAAAEGPWRDAQLVSDVVHLLAAGAWLGALPGLVYLLGATVQLEAAVRATQRFSTLAIAYVCALILSGIGNSWFLVGSIPALIGTGYGRLLLAKLALLAAMLALAALNRTVLTPRLAAGSRHALRALRRNALLEMLAGLLVVTIVGFLGITIPAAHQSPVWPFAHTLSWRAVVDSNATRWLLAVALLIACAGAVLAIAAARRRRWTAGVAGLAGIAAAAAMSVSLLAVAAYPTSYAASPVHYTTAAIVAGQGLYAEHCARCHGSRGNGDAPAAAMLSSRPANLVEHAPHHRPGDLYWWIAHGRPGTDMPAFAPALGDDGIWSIVQFLHALSDSAAATAMNGTVAADRALVAPDFAFELPGQGQQTLLQQVERSDTLIVLYTLPDSLARLRALVSDRRELGEHGVQVIAIAPNAATARDALAQVSGGESMLAITTPDVAETYAMLAARSGEGGAAAPEHAEFLVDRRGYLRARWSGALDPSAQRTADILVAAAALGRMGSLPQAPREHQH
ncbi:MAG TPA: copper homeostasis membrane protein CopD [Casimicrobiaceae bacterium]